MKRWGIRIFVFLLLGAIVNVAVAWAVPEIFWEKRTYTTYLPDGTSHSEDRVVEDARGWPMRSFASKFPEPGGTYSQTIYHIHGIDISHLPIWPGFAINTVFYAAIRWMLFALGGTPFALRRWRRIKHGLCPKCGYDLRGTPDATTCPECGRELA